MSISQATLNFKALPALLEARPVLLTYRRQPVAVAVAVDEWEAIEVELLTLEEAKAAVEAALKEAEEAGVETAVEEAKEV